MAGTAPTEASAIVRPLVRAGQTVEEGDEERLSERRRSDVQQRVELVEPALGEAHRLLQSLVRRRDRLVHLLHVDADRRGHSFQIFSLEMPRFRDRFVHNGLVHTVDVLSDFENRHRFAAGAVEPPALPAVRPEQAHRLTVEAGCRTAKVKVLARGDISKKLTVRAHKFSGKAEEKIKAESRTQFGKGAARRIRRDDKVPAVIYGHGNDPQHIPLPGHDTMMALKHGGSNALLYLDIEGKTHIALTKQVQADPIKGFLEHIDFVAVRSGDVAEPRQVTSGEVHVGVARQGVALVGDPVEAEHPAVGLAELRVPQEHGR